MGEIVHVSQPSQMSASERARVAWSQTQSHSREAVQDALLVLIEGARRAEEVATLPALPPGVCDDLRRLAETIAPVLVRVNALLGKKP